MHETGLVADLLAHVLAHAQSAGARRVTRVRIGLGALSGAAPDAMRFYFAQLAPGTAAEGAELAFDTIAGQGQCPACGQQVAVTLAAPGCPVCGAARVAITAGDGVYLESLELER